MLRIIGILALFGGCWLPPHIPDPIPRNQEAALRLDETRNRCADTAEQTPDLRTRPDNAPGNAPGAQAVQALQR
jgi:hypothetical protein